MYGSLKRIYRYEAVILGNLNILSLYENEMNIRKKIYNINYFLENI